MNTLYNGYLSDLRKLAEIYEERDDYANAEITYRKIVKLAERHDGQNISAAYTDDLFNLGLICYAQDKYSDAENFLNRVLAIEEAGLGANNEDLTNTKNLIATIFSEEAPTCQMDFPALNRRELSGFLLSAIPKAELATTD